MPEPSGVDGNGNELTNAQRPRPRPRLSLAISRNEDASLSPYENISDGWCLSTDENKTKKEEFVGMSSTSGRKDPSRGGSFSGVRRSTLPLSPSPLHSNIPVPRRASASVNCRSVNGCKATVAIGTAERANDTSSTATTLKCMPYNSPRSVPKSTRSNGHTNLTAKSSNTTNSRQWETTAGFRGLDNSRRLNQSLLQPESKKLSVSAGALQSSFVTKQSVIMRDKSVPLCRGGSVDVLNDSSSDATEPHGLKTEYRKSVSIPPRLVANMTSRFNALIERSHFDFSEQRTEVVQERSTAEVLFNASLEPGSSLSTVRSSPSSLINSKVLQHNVSRIQKPKPRSGRHLVSNDTGYVSANDDNESSEAEIEKNNDTRPWLSSLRPTKKTDSVPFSTKEDSISDESKPSSVKQAIRKYEVALIKNSTSSPELQRKPSLPREAASRQSKTLPTTVASRTLQSNNGVATLPNTPFRSSFRTSAGVGPCQASFLPQPTVNSGYGLTKPEAGSSTNLLSSLGSGKSQGASMSVTPGSPPVTALRTLFNYSKSSVECKYECKIETVRACSVVADPCEVSISPLASPKASANSRGRMLFQKRATRCSEESIIVSTSKERSTDSRTSSLDRALSSTLIGSMDLLAEIDNHPSLLPLAHRPLSTSSNASSEKCSSAGSVAPNTSFLWKESTQCQVSQEKKNPSAITESYVSEEGLQPDSSVYDAMDEPIYEELVNCTSTTSLQTQLSRRDLPLPLPDDVDDFSSSSDADASPQSSDLTTNGFRPVSSHPNEISSIEDNDKQPESDESWVDDSDSDGSAENKKSSTLSSKTRSRTKRQNGRRTCLVRRSWSQSLRDLAGSHSNEGTALEDLESGGWEEGFGSDESSDNAQSIVTIAKSEEAVASSSPQTDSDDKSPMSMNSEEASDSKDTNTKEEHFKERKGKKVKRNWSWSKSDFRLDLSSKLGKIRLTNNQKKQPQQQQEFAEKGVVDSSIATDVSPTKKKQWTFKTKFSTKKASGPLSPKRSPVKENAQFYVPTYNEDGTLATSPCCEGPQSIFESKSSEKQMQQCDDNGHGTQTAPKARRVSSCGTLSRPKMAPPAPPVSSVKFTDESSTCAEPPPLPPPNFSDDVVCGRDSKYRSSVSLDHGSVCRSNSKESEKSSIGYSQNDLGKIGAVSSSNVDVTSSVRRQKRTSSSTVSIHSGSSTESYGHLSSLDTVSGVQDELFNKFDGQKGVTTRYSSLEREQQIGQLGFTDNFTPERNRMSKLSPFEDEPLYQFYNVEAKLRAARENQVEISDLEDDDTDSCYESIYQFVPQVDSEIEEEETTEKTKTSAMDLVRSTMGGTRTLWCEVPEVRSSGILDSMSPQKRKLQEAMFEVITSEASYLKSLNVLVECFVHCPQLSDDYSMDCVLNKRERYVLFSDVIPVKETSDRLLADLEKRWQESIVISDICDILQEHATKNFDVYVKYCSNQLYQDRCLKKLKEENGQFIEVLQRLEANRVCQNLSMYSFLMLPMQRITRLPLLVDAIFNRLEFGTKQYETCKQALATLNKIVHECNEGAHRMERMEEMLIISRQLDFRDCKCLALISASRWLVKRGDLTKLTFGDSSSRLSFGRRCAKQSVYLFLFTDLLIVTKKKSDDCYNVLDYCPRNLVHAVEIESPEQLPGRTHDGHRNIFQLSMLQNHDNKTVEMFFSCPKESDLTRWVEAVTPRKSENPGERIYEEWDCPQVQALHAYVAQQPDELSLEESDVVNVFRKITDGWYQGERIRDGVQGWFPSNYTVEIVSSHIRARNLRQRYRLLALSHSYVENQRKKEQNKGKF